MHAFVPASGTALLRHISPTNTSDRHGTHFASRRPLRTQCPPLPSTSPVVNPALVNRKVSMMVDPWSVSSSTLDFLAAQFFAASLLPYLAFLYYLDRPQNETPALVNFGFRFLLVFVFATIPAGIYAKTHYNDILANIDYLHGTAESLLTVTNLLITLGLRNAMPSTPSPSPETPTLNAPAATVAAAGLLSLSTLGLLAGAHVEPANALSFPTWIIHLSSLIEWLVAMGLVWRYAEVSGNPRWKGLTWGMLPLHTSGIVACTYHLFYNAPSLNALVALQAALTFFGNTTLAAAAYRISKYDGERAKRAEDDEGGALVGFEDLAGKLRADSNTVFVAKLFAISAVASGVVKWGELYSDSVFNPTPAVAVSIVVIPTVLNMAKWAVRSKAPESDLNKLL